MKLKNKGKVYPSPSSSSSSSAVSGDRETDYFSVLKLLPAAILTLASVLSLEDREVLAYMITRSMKTTTSSCPNPTPKKSSKKQSNSNFNNHKVPIFDCDCFDCYTSYWFRWDSSPNRELIHQAIEAFEDHLSNGEQSKKPVRGKRRDKSGRRVSDKSVGDAPGRPETEAALRGNDESSVAAVSPPDDDVSPVSTPERAADGKGNEGVAEDVLVAEREDDAAVVVGSPAAVTNHHKGLARKVLPDVLGIFNSRIWSLWGPNV